MTTGVQISRVVLDFMQIDLYIWYWSRLNGMGTTLEAGSHGNSSSLTKIDEDKMFDSFVKKGISNCDVKHQTHGILLTTAMQTQRKNICSGTVKLCHFLHLKNVIAVHYFYFSKV